MSDIIIGITVTLIVIIIMALAEKFIEIIKFALAIGIMLLIFHTCGRFTREVIFSKTERRTMTDARKRFDPKLYEENDAIAKDFVKNLLKGTEYQAIDNPKKRGVDLLIYKDSQHICNIECEIKRVWKESAFPYASVQIPVRKEKYAILDKPTIFIMLNGTQSDYLAFTNKEMLASPRVEVPNKYVYKGEYFFQIDKNTVVFNDIIKVLGGI